MFCKYVQIPSTNDGVEENLWFQGLVLKIYFTSDAKGTNSAGDLPLEREYLM